jgi:hypothetical protein
MMGGMKPKPKTEMTGGDACLNMHVALRKLCDSPATSCLYNLVHILELPEKHNAWRLYGQLVADRVNAIDGRRSEGGAGESYATALKEARKALADAFFSEGRLRKRGEWPEHAETWLHAVDSALSCFSQQDWEGMAGYFE